MKLHTLALMAVTLALSPIIADQAQAQYSRERQLREWNERKASMQRWSARRDAKNAEHRRKAAEYQRNHPRRCGPSHCEK